jgi:hypothetical protein
MWNQDLLEKYEPKKMAKALVIAYQSDKKMSKLIGVLDIFEPHEDSKKFALDIIKHKENSRKRIEWI